MNLTFIAYYTKDTEYQREADGWRTVMKYTGMTHKVYPIADRGSWLRNVQAKADVCRQAVLEHMGKRICYLDVDSIVLKYPVELESVDCDIGAHIFRGSELLSGTLLMNCTDRTLRLMDRWVAHHRALPEKPANPRDGWDQVTLAREIAAMGDGITFAKLPERYTYIVGMGSDPDQCKPIIIHTRGSLRLNPEHK